MWATGSRPEGLFLGAKKFPTAAPPLIFPNATGEADFECKARLRELTSGRNCDYCSGELVPDLRIFQLIISANPRRHLGFNPGVLLCPPPPTAPDCDTLIPYERLKSPVYL
ncbi:unnamed protein product, partial [Iphiclides podalirius]